MMLKVSVNPKTVGMAGMERGDGRATGYGP